MYDVKECLERLIKIEKWKDVNGKINSKNKKNRTENQRYNAVYEEILKCSSQEKDNLEIIIKCEKGKAERFLGLKGLITMLISVISVIISIGTSFIMKMIEVNKIAEDNGLLMEVMNQTLRIVALVAILAIIIYTGVDIWGDRCINRYTYLLEILEKVKSQGKKGNN